MKQTLVFFCLLTSAIGLLHAQRQIFNASSRWQWGVKGGVNYDKVSNMPEATSQWGFRAGVTAEKYLMYNCYFQSAIVITSRGFNYFQAENHKGSFNGYFLEADGLFLFKFGSSKKETGILLGGGPYVSYGLWGTSEFVNLKLAAELNTPKQYNTFGTHPNALGRWDIGFRFGAGYDFNKHWQIAAYYNLGLNRVKYATNWQWRGWQSVLTYTF